MQEIEACRRRQIDRYLNVTSAANRRQVKAFLASGGRTMAGHVPVTTPDKKAKKVYPPHCHVRCCRP